MPFVPNVGGQFGKSLIFMCETSFYGKSTRIGIGQLTLLSEVLAGLADVFRNGIDNDRWNRHAVALLAQYS